MDEMPFDQIDNWMSFLNTCKHTAESKKNSLLQLAFRRDMKPDAELIDFYSNQIRCADELKRFIYMATRYLRKLERNADKEETQDFSEDDTGEQENETI